MGASLIAEGGWLLKEPGGRHQVPVRWWWNRHLVGEAC